MRRVAFWNNTTQPPPLFFFDDKGTLPEAAAVATRACKFSTVSGSASASSSRPTTTFIMPPAAAAAGSSSCSIGAAAAGAAAGADGAGDVAAGVSLPPLPPAPSPSFSLPPTEIWASARAAATFGGTPCPISAAKACLKARSASARLLPPALAPPPSDMVLPAACFLLPAQSRPASGSSCPSVWMG